MGAPTSLEKLLGRYEGDLDPDWDSEYVDPAHRYLLVQKVDDRYWLTTWATTEAAGAYLDDEEFPWFTEALIDLQDGSEWVPRTRFVPVAEARPPSSDPPTCRSSP